MVVKVPADALGPSSLRPSVQAAHSVRLYTQALGESPLGTLVADLERQSERAASGELAPIAADMLIAQASTLDAIFNRLARMATANIERPEHFAMLLKLAIRAQSACRCSLEALSNVMHPRVSFVGQNAVLLSTGSARAKELEISQSKLLTEEVRDGGHARLDLGAKAAAVECDSPLEALAALDRAPHARGQGEGGGQRVQGRLSASAPPDRESVPRGRKANGSGGPLDA